VDIAAMTPAEEALQHPPPILSVDENSVFNVSGLSLDIVHKTRSETLTFWSGYGHEETRSIRSYSWTTEALRIARRATREAGFETIGANVDDTNTRPADESWMNHSKKFRSSAQALKALFFPRRDNDHPYALIHLWCNGRKVFSTASENFGICPSDMQDGDVVCTFYDALIFFCYDKSRLKSQGASRPTASLTRTLENAS
jgi:hypothetical protein